MMLRRFARKISSNKTRSERAHDTMCSSLSCKLAIAYLHCTADLTAHVPYVVRLVDRSISISPPAGCRASHDLTTDPPAGQLPASIEHFVI
jgi:hypothetical protein